MQRIHRSALVLAIILIVCAACATGTAFADEKPLRAASEGASGLIAQSDGGEYFQNKNYVVFYEDGKVGIVDYVGSSKKVSIPSAVKLDGKTYPVVQIFEGAFEGTAITSVSVPSTVVSIDEGAFYNCRKLAKVTGCKGLAHIGAKAFWNCSKLSSFPFGKKLELIEAKAFSGSKVKTSKYPSNLINDGSGNYFLRSYSQRVKGLESYTDAYKVLSLVNKERKKEGLRSLVMDKDLIKAAMQRAAEISVVFDHTRPNGMACETVCPDKMSGENIAYGQDSPEFVMYRWMNSPGHRANILRKEFKSVGIGCMVVDGTYYWVQTFGREKADKATKPGNKTATHTVVRM